MTLVESLRVEVDCALAASAAALSSKKLADAETWRHIGMKMMTAADEIERRDKQLKESIERLRNPELSDTYKAKNWDTMAEAAAELDRLSRIEIKYRNLCPVLNEQAAEIQRLQQALAFWLPHMPAEPLPPYIDERLESAIWMLAGYNGPIEEGAEHLGWIKACFEPEREPG
jgi:hypothetical protein